MPRRTTLQRSHDTARRSSRRRAHSTCVTAKPYEALDPETGELRWWYMHNTGYWLGLDVHVGVYRPNGEPRLRELKMVLMEPGLYFGAWRPDVSCPPRYADIGIRIEDDVP